MAIRKVFPVGYGFPKPVPLIFAVAGLAVVLTGNPLELMEDEFRIFAALVSLLKLLMPLLLAGVDIFEIIVLLSAGNVVVDVVVASGGAAIPVLFLLFAVAGLAVVFAVAGLAVVFAVAGLAVVFAVAGLAVVFAVAGLAVVFAVAGLAVVFAV